MLPILPPLPPLASVLRLVAGTLTAAAGVALAIAAPPYWHAAWLPLLIVGAALALPVVIGGAE